MELSERCIAQLEKEGWPHVYEWSDPPGAVYEEHSHADKVVLYVTGGSLELTIEGKVHQLRTGDRFDIPPQVPHSIVVGPQGCQCVVGEMVDGDS